MTTDTLSGWIALILSRQDRGNGARQTRLIRPNRNLDRNARLRRKDHLDQRSNTSPCNRLAVQLERMRGVRQDHVRAFEWL